MLGEVLDVFGPGEKGPGCMWRAETYAWSVDGDDSGAEGDGKVVVGGGFETRAGQAVLVEDCVASWQAIFCVS